MLVKVGIVSTHRKGFAQRGQTRSLRLEECDGRDRQRLELATSRICGTESNAPVPGALKKAGAVSKGITQVSDTVYRKNHNMGLGIEILQIQ